MSSIDWGKFRQIAKAVSRVERGAENVSERINICTEIKCPYSYKTSLKSSSGCRRYGTASHCHLLHIHPELKKGSTEYFLHSDADLVNIPELKIQNDDFFLNSLENRESLEDEVEFGHQTLYAPYSEETFDLVAFLKR